MNVFLVGSQMIEWDDMAAFLESEVSDWSSDSVVPAEILVETAGRLCYMSFGNPRPGGNAAYIRNILEKGHGSVLEHAVFSFIFIGVSRSLTHELIRHRHFSVSELSQRYVDRDEAVYICPDIIAEDHDSLGEWEDAVESSHCSYRNLSETIPSEDRKVVNGARRSTLLECSETKIFVTGNARCWRNFIEQRASKHADQEIRQLANKVLEKLQIAAPSIFCDYRWEILGDGTHAVDTPNRKV